VSRAVLLRDDHAGTSASAGSETFARANRSALPVNARRKRSGEGEPQALCNNAGHERPPGLSRRASHRMAAGGCHPGRRPTATATTSAHAEPHSGATRLQRAGDAAAGGLALQTVVQQPPVNDQR
jgi:hypothetical protein